MYWEKQVIDPQDRGLIPAFRFNCGYKQARGGYEIKKHRYLTNRMAQIIVWDVYPFCIFENNALKPIKTFKTRKAAEEFVDSQSENK